jgi:hypothetical protein
LYQITFNVFVYDQVLSNYFKEKEAQLQKELGTQEAKRVQTEETASETAKKMMATEGNVGLYKSQVSFFRNRLLCSPIITRFFSMKG